MIEIKNVSYRYHSKEETNALNDICLNIETGEFVVFCGRSGCGKTTVTRLINGLIPNFYEGDLTGEVIVNGLEVSSADLSSASTVIGSVFQNPGSQFFNVDTTGELAFGCENQALDRSVIKERIDMTVRELSLEQLLDRSIFDLSGGEKQQIACGSVYAAKPVVYVLDEPSSNLDRKAIERLKKILEKLKNQGNTVVISEHRLYYLVELVDRFIYMADGRIEREFTSRQLISMKATELSSMGLRNYDLGKVDYELSKLTEESDFSNIAMKIEDLTVIRGKKQILRIGELELPDSAIIAVIGENGVGKSTFIQAVSGLIKMKGKIWIDKRRVSGKHRTRLSFVVMQDVNNQLFCEDVLEEITLNLKKEEKEGVEEILDKLALSEYKTRHPATLSGGQKQRVAVASAICAGKKIIFYDEPTSGLDYDAMKRFCDLIITNRTNQMMNFIITHDLELIMGCCTHVLHLDSGLVKEFYLLDSSGVEKVKEFFI